MSGNTNSSTTGITSCVHDNDTIARIALACAGVSGDSTVAIAIEVMGGAVPFVAAVHDGRDAALALSAVTRSRIRGFATASRVRAALDAMARNQLTVVTPLNHEWPGQVSCLLRAAPLILWTHGDVSALRCPSIAVTGGAAPTAAGIHMALELATGLAQRDWVIAAGAGTGVDELALKAAAAMGGKTIMVAAAGLDPIASPEHGEGGVEVSEVRPTSPVTVRGQRRAKHLLAALVSKVIIVDAELSSGAMRTGEAAHAMSRPVGVVSSPADGPATEGCRRLARLHDVALVASITDADRLQ
jgi:DNA processing protein